MRDEFSMINAVAKLLEPDHPWAVFAKLWDVNRTTGADFQAKLVLADRLGIKMPEEKVVDMAGDWTKLLRKYPLVKYVLDTYRYNRPEERMARETAAYIKGIDGTNCKG